MNILGLMAFGENPAACLLRDGTLVAFAEEERFTRLKGSDGMFPTKAVSYCLAAADLPLEGVDRIAMGWNCLKYPWHMARNFGSTYLRHRGRERRAHHEQAEQGSIFAAAEALLEYHPTLVGERIAHGLRAAGLKGGIPRIEFVSHHLAHAYSAYFPSPFDRAGVLTIDGSGEDLCTQLAVGEGNDLQVVETIQIPNSLGWFYAALTQYLGFLPYRDEGKVMGLAALGEERRATNKWVEPLSSILRINADSYSLDPLYTKFGGHFYGDRFTDELVRLITSVDPTAVPVAYGEKVQHEGRSISKYLLATYVDLAWALQELVERAAVMLARNLVRDHRVENICIAGGVGLNCKMNGEILRQSGCANIFVQPAASDAGSALGAALFVARQLGDRIKQPLTHVYYGPGFDNDAIQAALKQCRVTFRQVDDPALEAADRLEEGKIIAWFQGRMEFGARALGGRSILANLLVPGIKERVNAEVKYRESWRPFCPSVAAEAAPLYLERPNEARFMTVAYRATDSAARTLPAIVHVDGTMRPQTVNAEANPLFHRLLTEMGRRTGHSVVMNTSFNVRSEPVICTPLEAVRCFYSNGLDALIIGNFVLTKKCDVISPGQ
jgi:carbamoyltransferase